MKIVRFTLLIALGLILGACASSSSSGGTQNKSGTITLEEIEGAGLVFTDAYEIVRQFRPQWLIRRGRANLPGGSQVYDYVVIYVDNIRQGEPETLRSVSALSVQEIVHYTLAEAQRLGPIGHPHGAIVVRTKSR